jgi:uncharacterized membrane protein
MERDEPPSDLAQWAADFRAPTGVEAPSAASIRERVARDARKERLEWLAQIGGTSFAVIVFLVLVARTKSLLFAALAAIVLPTLIALFGYFVYLRLDETRVPLTTVREHVERAVRQRRIRYRFMRASVWVLAVLALGFWVWVPFVWLSRWSRVAADPWRLVVAVLVAIATFAVSFAFLVWKQRKTREDLEKWTAIAAAFDEDQP